MYQALRTSLWIDLTRQFVLRMDVSLVYDSERFARCDFRWFALM